MIWQPHAYQIRGVQRMLDEPALALYWPPGLGKSVVTLTAVDTFRRAGVGPTLVVAPLRVVQQVWSQEAAKWQHTRHLRVVSLHGSVKNDAAKLAGDVFLANYDSLPWLAEKGWSLFARKPPVLVLDEVTAIKNHETVRFKLVRGLLNHFQRRYILTGSPAPNGLHDLWTGIFVLDGGERLGKHVTHFRNQWFTPSGYMGWGEWAPKPGAEQEIRERIAPIVDRVDYEGNLEMPKRVDAVIHVALPTQAVQIYNEMEREFLLWLHDGVVTAANAAVKTSKLRQITAGWLYSDTGDALPIHEAKLEAVEEYVEGLAGQPALVVYEFDTERVALEQRLGWFSLHGGTRPKELAHLIQEWNAGQLPGLLVQPQSAGHGLNLQGGGRHLLWTSGTWSLELVDQMIGRLWRQGQTGTVISHRLVVPGTIDEVVWARIASKDAAQRSLLRFLRDAFPVHGEHVT